MAAYTGQPAESNPQPFTLTPFQPDTHKHLEDWATNALAAIKPWIWSLGARLGRSWDRNKGGYKHGKHSKERGERETRCKNNLALIERRHWYRACENLPLRYRFAARATILQLRRLITTGDWWRPRTYVDRATGELKETVYLPEDTWSAETMLDWCVSFLERLYASARGMAERVTPRYKPSETTTGASRAGTAQRGGTAPIWEVLGGM